MKFLIGALALAVGSTLFAESPPRSRERVVLRTNAGDLVLVLYPRVAPQHVGQILELVRLGAYDTTEFFRVVPRFLVQTAEVEYQRLPLSEAQRGAIKNIPLELSELVHRRGMVTMARQEDDQNSARTSFSILLADAPHLDGKYIVFGHLEGGYDVLDEMAAVLTDESNKPLERIEILKAEVVLSKEALSHMYIAGPKRLSKKTDPLASQRTRRFFLGAIALMIALAFVSFVLGSKVSTKVQASLSLLIILVGGFGLFIYFAPLAKPNHLHGIAVLAAILGMLKLMGKFEHPN